jgi:hypothetical protein
MRSRRARNLFALLVLESYESSKMSDKMSE